jgi:hypothetical protein
MKKNLAVLAVVLAACCALLVGSAARVRADECTTQGALALALADILGIKVTAAQAAADALALRGIAPKLGWDVEACLTPAVAREVRDAFGNAADFERAMAMIDRNADRVYPVVKELPVVSPARP